MAYSDAREHSGQGYTLEPHHILQYGLSSAKRHPSASSSSGEATIRSRQDGSCSRPKAHSSSSNVTHSSTSTRAGNRAAQRDVRTLPPWIDSFEDGEPALHSKPTDRLLSTPSRAHSAQHHHTPTSTSRRVSQDGYVDTYEDLSYRPNDKKPDTGFFGHREPVRGRKWDHAREGDPVIMRSEFPQTSPWRLYIKSSMYGPGNFEDGKRFNTEDLQQQTPGYTQPWRGDLEGANNPEKMGGLLHSKKRQRSFIRRVQHILLMHPLVPLIFRVVVFTTSIIALGLSTSVHHLSNKYEYPQNPSTTMAIVVDCVAVPYILYITWDEYTGKPLGLRSPKAKIRLVLLDLFFIIFESANLALAFAALTDDNGSCKVGFNGYDSVVCVRVKALCGILMVALIAWSQTFTVSIFRLVERVGGGEQGD